MARISGFRKLGLSTVLFMAMTSQGLAENCDVALEKAQSDPHGVAVKVRGLQSHLMVAALSCDLRSTYNVFTKNYKGQLIANGHNLQGFFNKVYGKKRGKTELTSFVTRLANEASLASTHNPEYCSQAEQALTFLTTSQNVDLTYYANSNIRHMCNESGQTHVVLN